MGLGSSVDAGMYLCLANNDSCLPSKARHSYASPTSYTAGERLKINNHCLSSSEACSTLAYALFKRRRSSTPWYSEDVVPEEGQTQTTHSGYRGGIAGRSAAGWASHDCGLDFARVCNRGVGRRDTSEGFDGLATPIESSACGSHQHATELRISGRVVSVDLRTVSVTQPKQWKATAHDHSISNDVFPQQQRCVPSTGDLGVRNQAAQNRIVYFGRGNQRTVDRISGRQIVCPAQNSLLCSAEVVITHCAFAGYAPLRHPHPAAWTTSLDSKVDVPTQAGESANALYYRAERLLRLRVVKTMAGEPRIAHSPALRSRNMRVRQHLLPQIAPFWRRCSWRISTTATQAAAWAVPPPEQAQRRHGSVRGAMRGGDVNPDGPDDNNGDRAEMPTYACGADRGRRTSSSSADEAVNAWWRSEERSGLCSTGSLRLQLALFPDESTVGLLNDWKVSVGRPRSDTSSWCWWRRRPWGGPCGPIYTYEVMGPSIPVPT
ncbi:hypothetical protein GGX14DRAFT_401683 [Mycena pura]|uniref:Uncharacterized protein n=1 Tax=Mycena pura TaxID=153505 RepID=A0AAD6Y399_9AGAR|nr:hypothetical protein GGX14DRAFT_401683 [Mycena pura]